mgnify:CR=1 FL=1
MTNGKRGTFVRVMHTMIGALLVSLLAATASAQSSGPAPSDDKEKDASTASNAATIQDDDPDADIDLAQPDFTLLALPYFILAGALMSASGMSQQLVDFSRVLVGHLRAGLAHASVVASMVFAGVSGSSTADASAIAAIVVPTMKKTGYKAGFAAALIATAGTIGAIIPPSMVMVVYGAIAQVSIGGRSLMTPDLSVDPRSAVGENCPLVSP